jgi:replicative DNA helicase
MSTQAEQALLGCYLVSNKSFELVEGLEEHHFTVEAHRLIYRALVRFLSKGEYVDGITLINAMGGDLERAGGFKYINHCSMSACAPKNAPIYAKTILESYRRIVLRAMSEEIIQELDAKTDTDQILATVDQRLSMTAQQSGDVYDIDDLLSEHLDVMMRRESGQETFTKTGLTSLDDKLGGGLSGGDLVVVAARPSMGKTAFAISLALNVSTNSDVLFYSLEMSKIQLVDRAVSNLGRLPMGWVRRPTGGGEEENERLWKLHTMAFESLKSHKLTVSDRAGQTMLNITATARAQSRKKNIGLIVVDYLGLIKGSGQESSKNLEIGEHTKALKDIAKSLNIPIVVLAQLNRKLGDRADKRPIMSDLRDSGEIENDADTIIFLHREEYYKPDTMDKGVCEVIIAKQRQGETGTVAVAFDGTYQQFSDLGRRY